MSIATVAVTTLSEPINGSKKGIFQAAGGISANFHRSGSPCCRKTPATVVTLRFPAELCARLPCGVLGAPNGGLGRDGKALVADHEALAFAARTGRHEHRSRSSIVNLVKSSRSLLSGLP